MNLQRQFAAETTALVLLLGVGAACGDATSSPPFASPATASPARPAAEDLTFTGALTGRMTAGTPGEAFACAPTGGAFGAGPILGTLAGKQIELNIAVLSFHGAGTYPADGVSFDAALDHYYPATGSPGTLSIASDLTSGTVDIALASNSDPDHAVAQVTGTWHCPSGGS